DVARARQVAGVMQTGRLQARRDVRGIAEKPDRMMRTKGQPPGVAGQAHRPLEGAHQRREPAAGLADDEELVGLVGRYQQRGGELLQQVREVLGLRVSEGNRSRRGTRNAWLLTRRNSQNGHAQAPFGVDSNRDQPGASEDRMVVLADAPGRWSGRQRFWLPPPRLSSLRI